MVIVLNPQNFLKSYQKKSFILYYVKEMDLLNIPGMYFLRI